MPRRTDAQITGNLELDLLARRLPKAELHLHLEGSIAPGTLAELRGRRGLGALSRADEVHDYLGMDNFFGMLERFAFELLDADGAALACRRAIESAVDSGARHVEIFCTPGNYDPDKVSVPALLDALGGAFAEVAEQTGVGGGVIVEFHRPDGPEAAVSVAREALAARDRGLPIVGVGNDGDYQTVSFAELAPGYDVAREGGLSCTGHADIPQDITDGLALGLDRLDHAFDLENDEAQLRRLVADRIPLTMCVTSNVIMITDRYPTPESHPFERLRSAGARIALGTDDPPLFFTDLAQEYRTAARAFGWDAAKMAEAALESLDVAWLGADRGRLLADWRREAEQLTADVRGSAPAAGE